MNKNNQNHNAKDIPHLVDAQYYRCTGEGMCAPFNRNNYYKIWLIENQTRLSFNDKNVLIDQPALVFLNPLVAYAYESPSHIRTGYWCVFKKEFLNAADVNKSLQTSPLFNVTNTGICFPDTQQLQVIKNLFRMMIAQVESPFTFKEDILRHYIHLLIYEGLKIGDPPDLNHHAHSASRITNQFLELLSQQFPVILPGPPLQLRKAKDFASRLSVHVNYLNHVVKEITGKPTTTIIAERMMDEARGLLKHSDWSIADIAYCLGFEYANHFNNYFKKHDGTTPAHYRKKSIL